MKIGKRRWFFFFWCGLSGSEKLWPILVELWKGSRIGGVFTINTRWWFQLFFIFTPDPWGRKSPILTIWYFSKGLKLNHQLFSTLSFLTNWFSTLPGLCILKYKGMKCTTPQLCRDSNDPWVKRIPINRQVYDSNVTYGIFITAKLTPHLWQGGTVSCDSHDHHQYISSLKLTFWLWKMVGNYFHSGKPYFQVLC